jgi:ribonuclease HII
MICGVDEAGRGPLAGPVCTAAVVLPMGFTVEGLDDSKKISAKKRDILNEIIQNNAVSIGVGVANPREIDELNIEAATREAMLRAVASLNIKPEVVLIDGIRPPDTGILQESIIGGDGKSFSIAAASVVAKVYRDRLMHEYAVSFPQYGFERHKGYGTAAHIEAIRRFGVCELHRMSFIKKDWLTVGR